MKIKILSRNPDNYMRETVDDMPKLLRNVDPALHPFQAEREYTRALNYTKLDKIFAKPFLCSLSGHRDGVFKMAKHPYSLSTLISGSGEGEIIFWNLARRENMKMIQAHQGMINGISCSPGGSLVTTVGSDATIKHWNVGPPEVQPEQPVAMATHRAAFSSVHHQNSKEDGGLFATTSMHVVDIWDYNRVQPVNTYKWDISYMHYVKFNPVESTILASCDSDHNIVIYDVRKKLPLSRVKMRMSANALAWNPMEAFNFTVASEDFNCYTFDMRRLNVASYVHKGHTLAVVDVDYSPTGQEFVACSFDCTLRIFPCTESTSREVYHTKRMQRVHAVQWSLDDRYIVSGSNEMNLRLWKARASEKLGHLAHRQRDVQKYAQKLQAKYASHPQISRIARHRHLPRYLHSAAKRLREHRSAVKRKEENQRLNAKPGRFPRISEKKRHIQNTDD